MDRIALDPTDYDNLAVNEAATEARIFADEPAKPDLSFAPGREGLRRLAIALRMPMPKRFRWLFPMVEIRIGCGTAGCAIGLARQMWPEIAAIPAYVTTGFGIATDDDFRERIAAAFGMRTDDASDLFFSVHTYALARDEDSITPEMVADTIDHYLATGLVEYRRAA